MTGHHPHDLLYGTLILVAVLALLCLMLWDVDRQCAKAQHEVDLDALVGCLVMLVLVGLAITGQLARIADAIEAQNKAYGIPDDSDIAAEVAAPEKGTIT